MGKKRRCKQRLTATCCQRRKLILDVPPFDFLLKAIGLTRTEFEDTTEVVVPKELLRLLLQVTVASSDFHAGRVSSTQPRCGRSRQVG